jgi:uncharacterized protein
MGWRAGVCRPRSRHRLQRVVRPAPGDQRLDDAGSLVFDGAPLAERLEILGSPSLSLELQCDRPAAMLAVRLCDVAPDGASLRVTYGLLNLAHRAGSAAPQPLKPGERCRVAIPLNHIAHAFPAGHRLRIAISTAYWPIAWPSPERAEVTLHGGTLALPIRSPSPEDADLPPFQPPEAAAVEGMRELRRASARRSVDHDPATGEVRHIVARGEGDLALGSLTRIDAIDLELAMASERIFTIRPGDPLSAVALSRQSVGLGRDGWRVTIETWLRQSASQHAFRVEASLRARLEGELVFERVWDGLITRDHL